MNDTNIKKDIDSVIINIETPHDDTNASLQELERDNWGRVLNNQTFTKMKDNFRLIKTAVSNFLTEVVNDLKLISDKVTKNETDIDTIGKKVKNLEDNGGKIDENTLALLADKTEENIFKENNTFEKNVNAKVYNLEGNRLAEMQSDSITIGDTGKSINIIGSGTKLLYNGQEISGSSGGSSSSTGSVDISNAYGVPVIAYTPTNTSLFEFKLTKSNMDNLVELDGTQYASLFNGDIPIVSDSVNVSSTDRGVPVSFKMYSGETKKNLIIPCARSVTDDFLGRLFGDSLSLLPLNKIYGFTFDMYFLVRRMSITNEVTKMFEATKSFEFRVIKGTLTSLNEIFSTENAIKLYQNGALRNGDWWLFNTFNLEDNENSTADDMNVYFKFMRRGIYNNCYIKNYITNTETQEKLWESMYITNASPFFENLETLSEYFISTDIRNSKILLKV